jgi:outer membrane protein OmpA-like peptidoglycan-associated protein
MFPGKTRRAARITAAAVGGVFAAALAVPGVSAAAPPKIENWTMGSSNGVLAFSVDAAVPGGNVSTIWPNGTNKTVVPTGMMTNDFGTVHGWSADGNRILATEVGDTTLRDFNPWTGTLVESAAEVWPGQTIQGASISPDGLTYAWGTQGVGYRTGNPTDGFTSRSSHASYGTAWSKSDRLAWINDEADAGEVNDDPGIYVVEGASEEPPTSQFFAVSETEFPEHVSLSADGTKLAYDTFENDSGSYGIKVGDAENGGSSHWLETGGRPTTEERFPAMSPDGTKVAFVSNRSGAFAIYTANWDGTNVQIVPNTTLPGGQQYTGIAWQPSQVPELAQNQSMSSTTEPGNTLSLDPLQEQGTAPLTRTYNWQSCTTTSAASCTDTGVTTAGYPVTNADIGKRFRLVRTVTNPAGSDTEATEITNAITAADTDPPGVPTITTKPGAKSNATSPTFAWTGAEAGGSYTCSIDSTTTYTPCTSGSTFPVSGEGPHTFRVKQTDASNNTGDPAAYTWTLDVTQPAKPNVTDKPSAVTKQTSATFTFTGDETNGSFECRFGSDGVVWSACTSPATITGMTDGNKRFSIRQLDEAGNPSDPEIVTWTVDRTAPLAPTITTKPGARSGSTEPTFAWTGAEAGGTYECALDGASFTACTSGSGFSVSGETSHTFQVRQVDAAGNPGATAEHTWTLDTTKPAAPSIGTKPAARSNVTAPTFTWTGGEGGGTFACSVDNAAFAPCVSGDTFPVSGQASHTFRVKQVDEAGNEGDAAEHTWTLDTTAPGTPTVTAKPAAITKATSATIEFTGTEAGGAFECRTAGGSWTSCTSPLTLDDLDEGDKSVEIRHIDDAGNVSATPALVEWEVDTTAPLAPTLDEDKTEVRTAETQYTFTGEPGETFECQLDAGAWEACTSPATLKEYETGEHTFRVRAVDAAGNKGPERTDVFQAYVDGPAKPTFTKTPDEFVKTSKVVFEFTGADPDGTGFECAIDGIPGWDACVSGVDVDGLPEGTYTFRVRQIDANGLPGKAAAFTWTYDKTTPAKPAVTGTPSAETTATSISIAVDVEPGAILECNLEGWGWEECTSPVNIGGFKVGDHTLSFRQTDKAGNVSEVRTISWKVVAPPVTPPTTDPQTPANPENPGTPQTPAQPQSPAQPQTPATPQSPAKPDTTPKASPKTEETPAKPKLTALIGGAATGNENAGGGKGNGSGTSSAATITVKKDGVGVGCAITGTVLTSCKVDLYADVATGATARAAAVKRVLVGTGTYRKAEGSSRMEVDVTLNATGRELLRKSPEGLKVSVAITGQPVKGEPLKAEGVATLVRQRTTARVGGFAVNSAQLTPAAKRQLTKLAKQVRGTAVAIRVVGHTDGSSADADYLKGLGKRRARTVAAFLRAHGVKAKATLVSRGAAQPLASNATKAGRAKNRRVELRIDR